MTENYICPVCKYEHDNEPYCSNCGFDFKEYIFQNTQKQKEMVIAYRTQWQSNLSDSAAKEPEFEIASESRLKLPNETDIVDGISCTTSAEALSAYRTLLKMAWADKVIDLVEISHINEHLQAIKLPTEQTNAIEREVIGRTIKEECYRNALIAVHDEHCSPSLPALKSLLITNKEIGLAQNLSSNLEIEVLGKTIMELTLEIIENANKNTSLETEAHPSHELRNNHIPLKQKLFSTTDESEPAVQIDEKSQEYIYDSNRELILAHNHKGELESAARTIPAKLFPSKIHENNTEKQSSNNDPILSEVGRTAFEITKFFFKVIKILSIIFILLIILAVVLPAYQDYSKRDYVIYGLFIGDQFKNDVETYTIDNHEWPNTIQDIGYKDAVERHEGDFSVNISLRDSGIIKITYNNGKIVELVPYVDKDNHIAWQCKNISFDEKYVPSDCRQ